MILEFQISRAALLKPCQRVLGAVERRHTLPVLGNFLVRVKNQLLSITGTDLEIEMTGRVPLSQPASDGEVTIPARKLVDICKALPDDATITFSVLDNKAKLQAGRSRFTLVCLPATDFPAMEEGPGSIEFSVSQQQLNCLLDGAAFSMAQQDSRYYLNGMLFEVLGNQYRVVAADGHRLAMVTVPHTNEFLSNASIIVPRKAVLELQRLFEEGRDEIGISLGANYLRAMTPQFSFTTKLIEGRFPDFRKVLPTKEGAHAIVNREELRQALARVAVLLNDKRQGVTLHFQANRLLIFARNAEREESEEELEIECHSEPIEIGFNVHYLIEYLTNAKSDKVKISFTESDQSVLLEPHLETQSSVLELYVVMPMRI